MEFMSGLSAGHCTAEVSSCSRPGIIVLIEETCVRDIVRKNLLDVLVGRQTTSARYIIRSNNSDKVVFAL